MDPLDGPAVATQTPSSEEADEVKTAQIKLEGLQLSCSKAAAVEQRVSGLSKVDRVLQHRTDSLLLVLERCTDNQNYLACLRTADLFGVQNVWVVQSCPPPAPFPAASPLSAAGQLSRKKGRVGRQASQWLDVRVFASTHDCIKALREQGWEIWATDLSQVSVSLPGLSVSRPPRLAIVMGREADGVSQLMLQAADRRVHLPQFGFSESHNLSVATALVLQQLFAMFPDARGDMGAQRKQQLRSKWNKLLGRRGQAASSSEDAPELPHAVESAIELEW